MPQVPTNTPHPTPGHGAALWFCVVWCGLLCCDVVLSCLGDQADFIINHKSFDLASKTKLQEIVGSTFVNHRPAESASSYEYLGENKREKTKHGKAKAKGKEKETEGEKRDDKT